MFEGSIIIIGIILLVGLVIIFVGLPILSFTERSTNMNTRTPTLLILFILFLFGIVIYSISNPSLNNRQNINTGFYENIKSNQYIHLKSDNTWLSSDSLLECNNGKWSYSPGEYASIEIKGNCTKNNFKISCSAPEESNSLTIKTTDLNGNEIRITLYKE